MGRQGMRRGVEWRRARFEKSVGAVVGALLLAGCGAACGVVRPAVAKVVSVKTELRQAFAFHFDFVPAHRVYRIGESIRFRVHADRDFYLYIFCINRGTGQAVLLIPNSKAGDNKYPGGILHTVPQPPLEFYSERPGLEKIIAVASTRHIPLDHLKYLRSGPFAVTEENRIEARIKDLRLRSRQDKGQNAVRELTVPIVDEASVLDSLPLLDIESAADLHPGPAMAGSTSPLVVLATDRSIYKVGQTARIAYGAERDGWVFLYAVDPGGSIYLLHERAVVGGTIQFLRAHARHPSGRHLLVAFYSASGQVSDRERAALGKLVASGGQEVGVEPAQSPLPIAKGVIWITDR